MNGNERKLLSLIRKVPVFGFALLMALSFAGCGADGKGARRVDAAPFATPKSTTSEAALNPAVRTWQSKSGEQVVLVIHGGCGVIPRDRMSAHMEQKHREALEAALRAGYAALQEEDATSLDGVVAAIKVMEDSPLFNAGHGAVFTREGKNELDASIMDGRTKNAGAVASVTTIKNPITAARAVMEKSGHVLMVAEGAEQFAQTVGKDAGIEIVDPSYFRTEFRWKQHEEGLKAEQEQAKPNSDGASAFQRKTQDRVGTVGAVALDSSGNLAAGTSTGGLNNKRHGRVGDCPIIGAGNYADNQTCAISSTGDGEFFLRAVAAHEISSLVKYKGLPIATASNQVIGQIHELGGDGAVIVLTRSGEAAFSYNTEGMYRGYITTDGKPHVFIYED